MNRLLTEFLGTFFLVLSIGLSVIGASPLAPLAIGATLMVMIYMGGHISGAHYNPAVTLAVFLRGKLPAKDVVPYWVAQIAGAVVAAAMARWVIMGHAIQAAPVESNKLLAALLVEFLYTFALASVVLASATAPQTAGNSFYGLAIGFTVVAGAIAGGSISGGAFNPAVGFGITIMGVPVQNLWLYIIGPLAGGALAAAVYKTTHPPEVESTRPGGASSGEPTSGSR
jgi:aquaporin Z